MTTKVTRKVLVLVGFGAFWLGLENVGNKFEFWRQNSNQDISKTIDLKKNLLSGMCSSGSQLSFGGCYVSVA